MAQLIGFRSMTAAAECPVTFGLCFYWLGARLLGGWGSICAVGAARPGSRALPVGEDLHQRRAEVVAPYREARKPPKRAAIWGRPYSVSGGCLYFVGTGPARGRGKSLPYGF